MATVRRLVTDSAIRLEEAAEERVVLREDDPAELHVRDVSGPDREIRHHCALGVRADVAVSMGRSLVRGGRRRSPGQAARVPARGSSLGAVGERADGPLAGEWVAVANEVALGVPLSRALDELSARLPQAEI